MKTSYAQNFEDIYLWQLNTIFAQRYPNLVKEYETFCDVGVWHPIIYNVSRSFIQSGWKGVLVEPNPEYFNLIESEYGNLENLKLMKVAASSSNGNAILNVPHLGDGLAYISSEQESVKKSIHIETRTLDYILKNSGISNLFYLKLDVEGHEFEILKSYSFEVRPVIICVEGINEKIGLLLKKKNFRRIFYDGLNSYFLDSNLILLRDVTLDPINIVNYPRYLLNWNPEYSTVLVCAECSNKNTSEINSSGLNKFYEFFRNLFPFSRT
jgi:FkbM family methyltransferase